MEVKQRKLSLFLAIVMLLGFVPFVKPEKVQAEANPEDPYNIENHPAHYSIDETTVNQGQSTNWNNVKHPVLDDYYIKESEIRGIVQPGASVFYAKGDGEFTEVTADGEGKFAVNVDSIESGDVYKFYAVKDGKKSPVTVSYPMMDNRPKGKSRRSIILGGASLINRGINRDEEGFYMDMIFDTQTYADPYWNFIKAKMFYRFDNSLAEHVKVIKGQRKGTKIEPKFLGKNNEEIPGVDVYYTAVMGTENPSGPVRAAVVGSSTATYKVYLKDETPAETLAELASNPQRVMIWGRYRNKELIENLSKSAVLNSNYNVAYTPNQKFYFTDSYGNPGPVVDTAMYELENNRILLGYRLNYDKNVDDSKKYDLYIKVDPGLAGKIDTVSFSEYGKHKPKDITTIDRANVTINTDTGEIIIPNVFDVGVFPKRRVASNRQDRTLYLNLKTGERITDGQKHKNLPFQLYVKDAITYSEVYNNAKSVVNGVTDKNFGHTPKDPAGLKNYNLKEAKQTLLTLIEQKNSTGPVTLAVDGELAAKTNTLNVKDIIAKVAANPHPFNVDNARYIVNNMSYNELGGWGKDDANRDKIMEFLDAAKVAGNFIRSDMTAQSAPGLIYENTFAETFIELVDNDQDGMIDDLELDTSWGSSPVMVDTDGDGINDGDEAFGGTDPLVAPFNWYDKDGNPIEEITVNTKEISGIIGNYSYPREAVDDEDPNAINNVSPRGVELYGNGEKIAETTSLEDRYGSFSLNIPEGKLQPDMELTVKIFTDPIPEKNEKDDEGVVRQGYANPEVSATYTVMKKTETPTIDHGDAFNPTFTYVAGNTEPNAEVSVTFSNKSTAKAVAGPDGRYKVMIADAAPSIPQLTPGDTFIVKARAPGKSISDSATALVEEPSAPPVLNGPIMAEQTKITGTVPKGSELTAIIIRTEEGKDLTISAPPEAITVSEPVDGVSDFLIDFDKVVYPEGHPHAGEKVAPLVAGDRVIVTAQEQGKAPGSAEALVIDYGFSIENLKRIVISDVVSNYETNDTVVYTGMTVTLVSQAGEGEEKEKAILITSEDVIGEINAAVWGEDAPTGTFTITPASETTFTESGVVKASVNYKAGEQNITSNEVDITVEEPTFNDRGIAAAELIHGPVTEYQDGEVFDPRGLEMKLIDNRGLEKVITYDEFSNYGITAFIKGEGSQDLPIDRFTSMTHDEYDGKQIGFKVSNKFTAVIPEPGQPEEAGDVAVTLGGDLSQENVTFKVATNYAGKFMNDTENMPDFTFDFFAGYTISDADGKVKVTEKLKDHPLRDKMKNITVDVSPEDGVTEIELVGPSNLTTEPQRMDMKGNITFDDGTKAEIKVTVNYKTREFPGLAISKPEGEDNSPVITEAVIPAGTPGGPIDKYSLILDEDGSLRKVVIFTARKDNSGNIIGWDSDTPDYELYRDGNGKLRLKVGTVERYKYAGKPLSLRGFDEYNNYTNVAEVTPAPIIPIRGIESDVADPVEGPIKISGKDGEEPGQTGTAPTLDNRMNIIQLRLGDRTDQKDLGEETAYNIYKDKNGNWKSPNPELFTVKKNFDGSVTIRFTEEGKAEFADKDLDIQGRVALDDDITPAEAPVVTFAGNDSNTLQYNEIFPTPVTASPDVKFQDDTNTTKVIVKPGDKGKFVSGDVITVKGPGENEETTVTVGDTATVNSDGTVTVDLGEKIETGTLKVTVTEEGKKPSPEKTLTKKTPGSPEPDPIRSGDESITLKPAEDSEKIKITVPGSPEEVIELTKDKDGNWTDGKNTLTPDSETGKITVPLENSVPYETGDDNKVVIVTEDKDGNKGSGETEVILKLDPIENVILRKLSNNMLIMGNATPNTQVVIKIPNEDGTGYRGYLGEDGSIVTEIADAYKINVRSNGKIFDRKVPKPKENTLFDLVTVVDDKEKDIIQQNDRKNERLKSPYGPISTIRLTIIGEGESVVTGSVENVERIKIYVNDVLEKELEITDGNYDYKRDTPFAAGDILVIEGYNGNVENEKLVIYKELIIR